MKLVEKYKNCDVFVMDNIEDINNAQSSAEIQHKVEGNILSIDIINYVNNELQDESWKNIIEVIFIDYNYDGIFAPSEYDIPVKKNTVKGVYKYQYDNPGKYQVKVKIVDVLGAEYFHHIEVNINE